MIWTSRPDTQACCPGPHGPVGAGEKLARLLHTRNIEPAFDPFRRSDFFPPHNRPVSNTCGCADGCSVVRCATLSDAAIWDRSARQAGKRAGREPQGAWVANVDDLRAIGRTDSPDGQVVRIYDDPTGEDPLHAIIRGRETLDRPDQDRLRERIRQRFSTRIGP